MTDGTVKITVVANVLRRNIILKGHPAMVVFSRRILSSTNRSVDPKEWKERERERQSIAVLVRFLFYGALCKLP